MRPDLTRPGTVTRPGDHHHDNHSDDSDVLMSLSSVKKIIFDLRKKSRSITKCSSRNDLEKLKLTLVDVTVEIKNI